MKSRGFLQVKLGSKSLRSYKQYPKATFFTVIRLKDEKESEVFPHLNRIVKTLREQGFSSKWAEREDVKRLPAIYFEQNVTTERFDDFDGERWVISGE